MLEASKGSWIGDRLEGANEFTIPQIFELTEGSDELRLVNERLPGFANVESGGRISMGGTRIITSVPDLHIFSFSEGRHETLRKVFASGADPYDAAVEVIDPKGLAQALAICGLVDGRPIDARIAVGKVEYTPVSGNIVSAPLAPPSPFRKAEAFARQSEWRITFGFGNGVAERTTITLPNPKQHFRRVA